MTNTTANYTASTRFRVRQVTSGYNGITKFIVWDLDTNSRVSVHADILREAAQGSADDLNISDMVRPSGEDNRPYKVRRAEAAAIYYAALES